MYELYDKTLFNVIILQGIDLKIIYVNDEFLNKFNINYDILTYNIEKLYFIKNSKDIFINCFVNKMDKKLKKICILDNRYFDIMINYKEEHLEIFIYEVTEYVENVNRIKKDREKFLSISTEIKTKCDIIENLRNREKKYLIRLKDVINNMSEGLIVLDRYGYFNFCNEAALKISSLKLQQISNYKEIIKYIKIYNGKEYGNDLEEVYDNYKNHVANIKNLVIKCNNKQNNEQKYIELNCNPILNEKGKLIYTVITLKDITETKINEIKIKEQNRKLEKVSEVKDEFFNMISHELRTPITIIYSSLQLANDIYSSEITPNIRKILLKVSQNCSRLLKLVNNILDISKAEGGFLQINYSVFDVIYLTENLVTSANLYAKSKGIDLIFDTNLEEVLVKLDKDKYERIILNLLSNAIKFTPKDKKVMIIININDSDVRIKVRDEGIGIAEENIENIFDRFAQVNSSLSRKAEGTGLGLTLVKKLVELMKGKIDVKSKINQGTEFCVKFNKEIIIKECKKDYYVDSNLNDKVIVEFSDV
ncbi:ATP-binding protein [Clostridium aestuarii]|uniref:histidine kinase n=1 Tax=Clostridium aestuarii TaxID=338193 RepID=A0ABT4CXU7_9CLOT|nr:ATP-binding protein [Clostridium aestuarii]MCY6483789.1 ATP-binding protein [Clostridium aestuarii]